MGDFEDNISSLNNDQDLTTDEAPAGPQARRIEHNYHRDILSKKPGQQCFDERNDSGLASLGTNSSIRSNFDSSSLESNSFQKSTEYPAICEDDVSEKLKNCSLVDEGIVCENFISTSERNYLTCSKVSPTFAPNINQRVVIDFTEQDKDGDTFVHLAIIGERESMACDLVDMVPNIGCLNTPNSLYQRPVHLAVLTKQTKVLQKLVSRTVDISCQDHHGNTPLHLACRNGDIDSVKIILRVVIERQMAQCLEIRNSDGLACFHLAARATENRMNVMFELIKAGANVNASDAKSGRTLLHYAAETNDIDLVRFLVKNTDIELDAVAFDGKPAIYIAFWRNYQDIVKRLRKAGADFDYNVLNDSSDDSDEEPA